MNISDNEFGGVVPYDAIVMPKELKMGKIEKLSEELAKEYVAVSKENERLRKRIVFLERVVVGMSAIVKFAEMVEDAKTSNNYETVACIEIDGKPFRVKLWSEIVAP